jgi:molybdopterin converting factor small subunit
MTVRVLLFGAEAIAAGRGAVEVDLPAGQGCAHLRRAIVAACPALGALADQARFAINSEFAAFDAPIRPGDEVALIGLVSGG